MNGETISLLYEAKGQVTDEIKRLCLNGDGGKCISQFILTAQANISGAIDALMEYQDVSNMGDR